MYANNVNHQYSARVARPDIVAYFCFKQMDNASLKDIILIYHKKRCKGTTKK